MAKLTAAECKQAQYEGKVKRLADGDGLYLVLRPRSKAWMLKVKANGRFTDKGLGSFPQVSLREARRKARERKADLLPVPPAAVAANLSGGAASGGASLEVQAPTFMSLVDRHLRTKSSQWKTSRIEKDTRYRLEEYCTGFADKPVDTISKDDVLQVLEGLYERIPNTAKKLRQSMKSVFDYAVVLDYIPYNPVDALKPLLPKKTKPKHHPAVLYRDVPAILAHVANTTDGTASHRLCFRFLILTGVRSGEARGARWSEVDMDSRMWSIPAERMKTGILPHKVPLSDATMKVLEEARVLSDGDGHVFPSTSKDGKPITDVTLSRLLRSSGHSATIHGFRTSFRTWMQEKTDTPFDVGETALAHAVGNEVAQAYARSDLYERRRELMDAWGAYVLG